MEYTIFNMRELEDFLCRFLFDFRIMESIKISSHFFVVHLKSILGIIYVAIINEIRRFSSNPPGIRK